MRRNLTRLAHEKQTAAFLCLYIAGAVAFAVLNFWLG